MMSRQEALAWGRKALFGCSDSVSADAELLLCHELGCDRAALLTHGDETVPDDHWARYQSLIQQRVAGHPVAYLIGEAGFWTLTLQVNDSTLIPRPDTEVLVETVLAALPERAPLNVVDLGTGTGAIALALARERPAWSVSGTDYAPDIVALARGNAQRNGVEHILFMTSDWCHDIADGSVDVLVSNPPYVAADDPHLDEGDLRFEPRTALTAGPDGLAAIQIIVHQSARVLRNGGYLFLEHGYDQADAVQNLLSAAGFCAVETHRDYGGNPRVTFGRFA